MPQLLKDLNRQQIYLFILLYERVDLFLYGMPRTCDLITALGALFLLAFDNVLDGACVAEGVLG